MHRVFFLAVFIIFIAETDCRAVPRRPARPEAPAPPAAAANVPDLSGKWGDYLIVQHGHAFTVLHRNYFGHGHICPNGSIIIFWEYSQEVVGVYRLESKGRLLTGRYAYLIDRWDIDLDGDLFAHRTYRDSLSR